MSAPRAVVALESEELFGRLFDPALVRRLERVVRLEPRIVTRTAPELPSSAADAEILITGWGAPRLDGRLLERMPHLEVVVHAAGTVKGIVSPELWQRGVRVSSSAQPNALPVAEYTLAMILLSAKDALGAVRAAEGGAAPASPRFAPIGAFGVTVGVVGASRVGRRLLELLRPFDVRVLLYDPSLSASQATALGATLVTLPTLLAQSRIVTLHAPSLPETHHMIGAAELASMPVGSTLINTARGSLVDTDALVAAVAAGHVEAVLDVTDPEPLPPAHPLRSLPGAFLTPHIAGSLGNELQRIGAHVVGEVELFVDSGRLTAEVEARDLATIA